jgi:glycine/D-amino acid oxidase-like deaminating enzyme
LLLLERPARHPGGRDQFRRACASIRAIDKKLAYSGDQGQPHLRFRPLFESDWYVHLQSNEGESQGLDGLGVTAAWAGYIDSTPDGVPAIGEIPGLLGFILAAGFSGHGFGIGPGAGHLVADIVTAMSPIVDPAPYRPERLDASVWGKVAEF